MREMKTVEHRYRSQAVDSVRCDCCNRINRNQDETDWATNNYAVNEIIVSRETGTNYPSDGMNTTTERFHVCPDCWDAHVKTLFASFNSKPTIIEKEA